MIFETERLRITRLKPTDLEAFHEMQANKKVMLYTDCPAKTRTENVRDLADVISKYKQPNNKFWVWAVIRKEDDAFLGTTALIDNQEVGFRFLEKYWGKGYGFESLQGLVNYAKTKGFKTLIADVYAKNKASEKILLKLGFVLQKEHLCKQKGWIDRHYQLTIA